VVSQAGFLPLYRAPRYPGAYVVHVSYKPVEKRQVSFSIQQCSAQYLATHVLPQGSGCFLSYYHGFTNRLAAILLETLSGLSSTFKLSDWSKCSRDTISIDDPNAICCLSRY